MNALRLLALAPLTLVPACGSPGAATGGSDPRPWSAPSLEHATAVRDGRTGETATLEEMFDDLARADVVFLGETHTDETTHRVELAVYEALIERRGGKVVLAMEMFERDAQPALDEYIAGEIDEEAFLAMSNPWGNYRTGYRPMIERARAEGLPVVGSNFPRSLRRRMMMEGTEVLDALGDGEKHLAPAELMANTPAYWRRVDNAVRGHIGMMGGPKDPSDPRLTETQSLWDNSMGEACALALDANPGHAVLHVNGGFHSEYWDGTVHQLKLRKPDADVRTVAISTTTNPGVAFPGGLPRADWVVYAEARASDENEGRWAVRTSRDHHYRFHLPESATDEAPVPLVVWLGDDGLTAQDGMDLLRPALGDDVAICVLEASYREIGFDLGDSGRWFFADTFSEDAGTAIQAVERAWAYLLRHYPIDPERVVVAGEGTGATMVGATTLLTGRVATNAVALFPRRYAKIKDFPLPLPELDGDDERVARHLSVLGSESDREWWADELAEYEAIGLPNAFDVAPTDAWDRAEAAERALRDALGLEARPVAEGPRRYVVVDTESPRAVHWGRLVAERERAGGPVAVLGEAPGSGVELATAVRAADFALGGPRELPRAPGAFGGTTVVVLTTDEARAQADAWLALEESDPLGARSRFLRTRIATGEGDRTLSAVLEKLRAENRKNVLVVPATFCADGVTVRSLAREVRHLADEMTLAWLPGLGGGE